MGSMSIWHWLIVALVVLILFGRGRISEVMGDFGKGIKSFKKGMAEAEDDLKTEEAKDNTPPRRIEDKRAAAADAARERDSSAN